MPGPAPGAQDDRTIENVLRRRQSNTLLRFITCGSVDDGKSTLIGRLLYDSRTVFDDHLEALVTDSKRLGTCGDRLDFALLLDGLSAEREQKITIDVAYRFFATDKRTFSIADTPGHHEYTRNMVTGASTADLAVILVDARKGLRTQTKRHTYLVHLLGIRHVVVAVNKMDLVGYSKQVFAGIERQCRDLTRSFEFRSLAFIPTVAVEGENVTRHGHGLPWYDGPTLLEHLEDVALDEDRAAEPFRLPVQWVNRPTPDFRGFAGTVASGSVRIGDRVRALPSGATTRVDRIMAGFADVDVAVAGQAVTLTLADDTDVSRGDVLADIDSLPRIADRLEATVVWLDSHPLLPGRSYLMKIGTRTVPATVIPLRYRVNIDSLEHAAAASLELNDIGVCGLQLDRPVAFEPYHVNHDLGGFILIDRLTNATSGAGVLRPHSEGFEPPTWQPHYITKEVRSDLKGQRPCIVWFTGLSAAGKSTIANVLEQRLHGAGRHTYVLDGDNLRYGINRDLGFTDSDRVENVRRIAEIARLMADAGLIVLVAAISPFRAERRSARETSGDATFIEVFVDTPLDVAECRDPKGLYRKARRGELTNFTGVDSPYEAPERPEVRIDTTRVTPEEGAELIVQELRRTGVIPAP